MLINGGRGISTGPSRRQPLMGPMAYKTYTLRPVMRKATCVEVDCPHYHDGWTFAVKALAADPKMNYAARNSGKRFAERELNGEMYLVYEPGQPCFGSHLHKLPMHEELPAMFVGRGDPRTFTPQGLPRDARRHTRVDDWVDDFATHQARLAHEIEKG